MQKKVLFIILAIFIVPLITQAATFVGEREYTLSQNQIIDQNLYVAGSNLILSGEVNGDVLAAGGNILITGSVSEDIAVVGGTINILGVVGEDARLAGGTVIIGNTIGGDLVIAAGSIKALSGAIIQGDALINGGTVTLGGQFQKGVKINAGEVFINGLIMEDLRVRADKITVGDNARIRGNFSYFSSKEAVISSSAVIEGETLFNRIDKGPKKEFAALWALAFGMKFLILLVAGLIAMFVFKRYSKRIVSRSFENIGKNIGIGFLVFVGLPLVSILLLLSLIGSLLGGIAIAFFALMIMIAKVYAGIVFGFLLYRLFAKNKEVPDKLFWQTGVLGIILLSLLASIPIVGWILGFLLLLLVLGTISNICYGYIKNS